MDTSWTPSSIYTTIYLRSTLAGSVKGLLTTLSCSNSPFLLVSLSYLTS